jgi:hypothetical protein
MMASIPGRTLAVAACCVLVLAGCNRDKPLVSAVAPRGATVAFDSIDGPPPAQFRALVLSLNEEAQSRRLAVISREQPAAYRVRGYLAAEADKDKATISWVWDVFDRGQHRALRIVGTETAKQGGRDAWQAVDDAMLRRIAHASMDQLAAFLTSPQAAPGIAAGETPMAMTEPPASSPEAAGIFRIFRPHADPVAADGAGIAPIAAAGDDATVPLPRHRPETPSAVSMQGTLTLSAVRLR